MLTATQLAKSSTELAHQVALFAYIAIAKRYGWDLADAWDAGLDLSGRVVERDAIPELKWFHAVPNGGSRDSEKRMAQRRGLEMVAQGVRKGVADTFLPVKRGQWSGLYIELKRPSLEPKTVGKKGGLSDEQIEFAQFVREQGYGWMVCYSWRQAATAIQEYLSWSSAVPVHDP